MPYDAPSRDVLRESLARDLRDPQLKTFTVEELDDLLNLAIVEVSRVYPKEDVVSLEPEQDYQYQYDLTASALFRVELMKDGAFFSEVPQATDGRSDNGWDLHAAALYLPAFAYQWLTFEGEYTVRAWGYWPREQFADDTDVLDGDAEAEFAVRTVSALNGYQRLQNDRLLFQQWLTNTGNTDVSPNQLAQTADMYQSQWREMRNRLRTLQRV